ncbi:nucleotidyl transferase AbiEii/AbiGii toxin family protein [Caenimonas sedimenti]|uniref:Nucleotidyl transferase AbiEii/AbiGii toxin family protein n=1 Tax=Caenimonas sedimenti TaxID=2596921 RepID=A0A562ZNZ8_9BURK|nr:nucleotidyl transferase AbiEii/AbiGii toxin family protein [Caenimonas sedimenti]TWO70035.1 nucleotidyl transferase AbiEii/AbiGii toxin family protein [Caenimonas sedimenti]
MSKNPAASIRAQLKNHADATKQDFNLVLTHFGLERVLYRLSVSPHAGNYLLKGALLFSLWYDLPKRPTRDADLLGFGAADTATAIAVFKEICRIDVADGMVLDPVSVKGAEIRKEAGYGGVRIDLVGRLDSARIPLQIDIGFGDAVSPGPESVTYPVLLQDLPAPLLRAYPKYTVIAEKFHAICLLGMANTRMKDYFDLSILLSEGDIEPFQLRTAIEATFARRKYRLPEGVPLGLADAFAVDAIKQRQWMAFLQKNRLHAQDLTDTIRAIRESLIKMGVL